ncbi:aldehyde dehydrogenase [Synechococcus sp. WH 8020]|uniref:aldehyde dehydrogenase family protein n=1 Tax=Synechococcus sp. (strain WH8020) TaxID=32052 RepID=UPI0006528229|nr:aldehyde dehydrogenase family protein [Synechococcus sp. WH 8020]AKN59778.1 aldehyde dehydrogenase [Synechococcus sp. WH 8020]
MVSSSNNEAFQAADLKTLRSPVVSGQTRPEAWRRKQLKRLSDLLHRHEADILHALRVDLAKPALEGMFEIVALLQELKVTRRRLKAWMRARRIAVPIAQRPGRAQLIREPLGCVLVIGPWNYPFMLTLQPLISALAAGNTVVLKPSEHAPASAALITRLITEAFPSDVVRVVNGDGSSAAALVDLGFDHIFFTGGGGIGAKVLAGAARHLTPVTLELGGKNPAVVLESADLTVTARRLIWGKGVNAGQTCLAPDHLLVQTSIREHLVNALKEERRNLYGEDPLACADLGCLIHDRHFQYLEGLITTARDEGRILFGGECDRQRRKIAPTLIEVHSDQDPLMTAEIFGPLLPILTVESLDGAITRIQQQDKPLAIYLFGGDHNDQNEVLQRTSSGGVCFNDLLLQKGVPELPFGGVGPSGMGSYQAEAGFRTFSHERSVLSRPWFLDLRLRYPPYTLNPALFRRFVS